MILDASERLQWHGRLAPGHERRDGCLLIGGAAADDLADAYGTPLLAIDYDVLDAAIATFREACEPHGMEIAYAGKALLLTALARHLKHTPLLLDVCSLAEIVTAERAGFPPDRIAFHGCGKTPEELDAAAAGRVGVTIVDHADELRALAERAKGRIDVVLRVNTGVAAHTHDFVRTAGERTKFGFDPDGLAAAVELLRAAPQLRFRGLHAHIGSQIYDQHAFEANADALMERAAYVSGGGLECERLIVGGGFGVQMHPDEPVSLNLRAAIAGIAATVAKAARRRKMEPPRLGIEPGRALVAHAGTSLYRVVACKREFGRRFAIVDGGMFENPRPALYGAYHHAYPARESSAPATETVLCGRSCENDELGIVKLPEDLAAGDLLAACTTGAYTYSMASNYNRFPRPAVVAVRAGTHRPIAARETVEDVLRHDCD